MSQILDCTGRSRADCFLTLSLFSLRPAPKLKVAENSLPWEVIVGAVFSVCSVCTPGPDHPASRPKQSSLCWCRDGVCLDGCGWPGRVPGPAAIKTHWRRNCRYNCLPATGHGAAAARHWAALVFNVISATLQCAVLMLCVLACVLSCFTPWLISDQAAID